MMPWRRYLFVNEYYFYDFFVYLLFVESFCVYGYSSYGDKVQIKNDVVNIRDNIHQSFHQLLLNRSTRNVFLSLQDSTTKHVVPSEEKAATNNRKNPSTRPNFKNTINNQIPFNPLEYRCTNKYSSQCQNQTAIFGEKILTEFRKYLEKPIEINDTNIYNVNYNNKTKVDQLNRSICMVMSAKVRTLRKKDSPLFNENGLGKIFPKKKLFKQFIKESANSCVIISSAGSLSKSNLGNFIDSHDIVMRFNNAPVEGFESDVGKKTTIRIVNSQVVSKPQFNFIGSSLFQNISLAAWDPGKFNGTIHDWINAPDFNIFDNYKLFMSKWPKADFHLIDPRSIWNLWKSLQMFTKTKIRWNPPSSGFIGLALLLPVCNYVDFIEYVPSTRISAQCHYYDDESNAACTFGSWHPLAAEKLMAYDMNSADKYTVFQSGILRIYKPSLIDCINT